MKEITPKEWLQLLVFAITMAAAWGTVKSDLKHIEQTLSRHEMLLMKGLIEGKLKNGTP